MDERFTIDFVSNKKEQMAQKHLGRHPMPRALATQSLKHTNATLLRDAAKNRVCGFTESPTPS